jgi:hypothetical protein
MARVDQVRSYLEKLAGSEWPGAVMDDSGQIRIRNGTAVVSILAEDQPASPVETDLVYVASAVAKNVPDTPALFSWLNEQNNRFARLKIVKRRDNILAWVCLNADDIDERDLKTAVGWIGVFADEIDDKIVATFGGQLPWAQPQPA